MAWVRVLLTFLILTSAAVAQGENISFRLRTKEQVMDRIRLAAAKNEDRQANLKKLFNEEGCTGDKLTEEAVKHVKLGNVICTLPGETDAVIVVSAHFDKVRPGMGATDNWSGASLLPSLFYGVSASRRKHTYLFIGFTDEEEGMVGSQYYASHLTKEQREKIKAVINMDTLGLGPTEVWASRADPELKQDLVNVAGSVHISLTAMNVDKVGSTDSESFARYKIPHLTLHSVTQETFSILHSDRDQVSVIKADDYYDSYRLITVFLAYLDGKLPTDSDRKASAPTSPKAETPSSHVR